MLILQLFILFVIRLHRTTSELNLEVKDYALVIQKKLWRLRTLAHRSIFVHEHIPKVGGTALALALSSECVCVARLDFPQDTCQRCPRIYGKNGFSFSYTVSRASGWIFGLHPPLARYFTLFNSQRKRTKVARHGLLPVYVVMLREPFARFVSEARNWVGHQQVGVDWSIWYKAKVKVFDLEVR